MVFIESILIALSTYSAIPVPQFEWNEKNMKYSLSFFPMVGVICGTVLAVWYKLSQTLNFSDVFFAVIATCIPLLITGGIHMDGFIDTVDALASHQSMERKLEILKDSSCGAFAVIYFGVYVLLYFGFIYELYRYNLVYVICPGFVLSRILAVLFALSMPNARKSGMMHSFKENMMKSKSSAVLIVAGFVVVGSMLYISGIAGVFSSAFAMGSMMIYRHNAMKQFKGTTGDTTGFSVQICELSILVGAFIGGLLQ